MVENYVSLTEQSSVGKKEGMWKITSWYLSWKFNKKMIFDLWI